MLLPIVLDTDVWELKTLISYCMLWVQTFGLMRAITLWDCIIQLLGCNRITVSYPILSYVTVINTQILLLCTAISTQFLLLFKFIHMTESDICWLTILPKSDHCTWGVVIGYLYQVLSLLPVTDDDSGVGPERFNGERRTVCSDFYGAGSIVLLD